MSLYTIDMDILNVLENGEVNEETGEYTVDETALAELKVDRVAKVDNILRYMKNLEAEADAIKAEIATQQSRLKHRENVLSRLKEIIRQSMERNGETKLQLPIADLSLRKSETTVIDDEEALPDKFVNVTITAKPDKKRIKEALKAGEEVAGAHIEVKQNLQVK